MKRVITYGTFDLLHYGHINLLRRAKALGDYLVVALSTDEFNSIEKGKKTYFSYEQRKLLLESLRYVDLVIPESGWDQKAEDVKLYKIDTFVMGDDWEGKFDFLKEHCEVVYLPRTPEISTTQIKKDLFEKDISKK
ncbi:MAG: glycerol-3-phosphate cytidylyltransferase [Clostridiales bacterium]|nr:glycerol-3-phosphate cytidylyltransferase [Clostridiales bacterium]